MSVENHPNFHAVGFLMDIYSSFEERVRGEAAKAGMPELLPLIADRITEFVNEIDEILDKKYGGT